MALNPDYVPLTPLWEVFTDKDLLTFLADGYVLFFVDTARTVGKPVYQLTGSPPNYSYVPYGSLQLDGSWRVNMNLQGAFDQVIYGYPLDENGDVQLYFAEFYSSDGVFQFSREGFPNFFIPGGNTPGNEVEINFIPNGQFRLHEDIPATLTLELGQVREATTNIAYGGWTFKRPMSSTARDFVTFQRIGSYVTNPEKSPRYAVEVTCEAPNAGDTFKDLSIRFDDVNKFSSDTDMYTYAITSKTVSSGNVDVELVLIKNFGTGGDATTETVLTTFTITSTFVSNYFAFTFGSNTGKIIGQNNDDYLELAIRYPSNELFDIQSTDALLTPGNIISPIFNDTTTREFLYESLFDDTDCPAFDGYDIGLPLVLTKTGIRFDDSQVGMIFASSIPDQSYPVPYGFLYGDGSSYDSTLHSSDGIPYYRLRNKLLSTFVGGTLSYNIPIYGTGANFITSSITADKKIRTNSNIAGAVSNFSNGTVSPGFTFNVNHVGETTTDAKAFSAANGDLYIISDGIGKNDIANNPGTVPASFTTQINGPLARHILGIEFTGVPAAGEWFTFYTTSAQYLVWYKRDGAGTIPSVPGTIAIEIDLFTGIDTQDVANITANAISGYHCEQILTVIGSAIPQSSYVDFSSTTQDYYFWYNIDDNGTDPMVVGKIGVEIQIASTDTKDQVTVKTVNQLNARFFATPDLRGIFLKGLTGTSLQDTFAIDRYATNSVNFGNIVGSREYSNNISHNHQPLIFSSNTGANPFFGLTNNSGTAVDNYAYSDFPVGVTPQNTVPLITYQGQSESRPENIYVNYVIKY